MQFIDEAKIHIKSGNGGNGCVSFRRERNIPRGGPDGGNGGSGGSVYAEGVKDLNTLVDFRFQQHFKASSGQHGMGKNRYGANAEDLIIKVPVGTQIMLEDGETLLADITKVGQRVMIARGGKGGVGNTEFKSSTNRAPRQFTEGTLGAELEIWLRLKLLSDVGLVGLPNAGKSTFLSAVTCARPKIADYPFTTLKPKLGVAYIDEKEFVIADLPGLIEGASEGQGLGHRFLKHVERCATILHLVDATSEEAAESYVTIREELRLYNPELAKKQEIIALTKADALDEETVQERKTAFEETTGKKALVISSQSKQGIETLLRALYGQVDSFKRDEACEEEAA